MAEIISALGGGEKPQTVGDGGPQLLDGPSSSGAQSSDDPNPGQPGRPATSGTDRGAHCPAPTTSGLAAVASISIKRQPIATRTLAIHLDPSELNRQTSARSRPIFVATGRSSCVSRCARFVPSPVLRARDWRAPRCRPDRRAARRRMRWCRAGCGWTTSSPCLVGRRDRSRAGPRSARSVWPPRDRRLACRPSRGAGGTRSSPLA